MPLLFAVTLFVSATLLFMVQPMVGKMVLPLLGGSPAVWNACMVFFQALLLLGYLYAHWVSHRFPPGKQWRVHMMVLAAPVTAMTLAVVFGWRHIPIPVAESLAPTGDQSPFVSVMAILAIAIGVPFFVASTSAPLLQKWFAYTGHPSARDPYFLYAASNAGSLISLLGYPLFTEPNLAVAAQAWLWGCGFLVLIGLIALCGQAASHPVGVPPPAAKQPDPSPAVVPGGTPDDPPPSRLRVARWVALGFVPSSLMLGVTFYISTDIVSLPLIWVFPLALYLLTFIIAFSRLPSWFRLVIGNLAPVALLLLVFCTMTGLPRITDARGNHDIGGTLFYQAVMHIAVFFCVALMCHYELARDRPSPRYLTGFFLWISVGGVLGGIFNGLIAPLVFTAPTAIEYPIVLCLACLLVPDLSADATGSRTAADPAAAARQRRLARVLDFVIPAAIAGGFWVLTLLPESGRYARTVHMIARNIKMSPEVVNTVIVNAIPVMACFFFVDRPLRFALCVAGIVALNGYQKRDPDIIWTDRTFFGILKVEKVSQPQPPYILTDDGSAVKVDEEGRRRSFGRVEFLRLVHGTTLHGTQIRKLNKNVLDYFQLHAGITSWDAAAIGGAVEAFNAPEEPLTYYHRTGPVGAMFHELRSRKGGADRTAWVAMVGLGTGSVSCYALPGQKLTFYEIDPAVKRLVADSDQYFTYVTDARNRGGELDFRMGDARLKLKQETDPDRKYALLLVDAFSSDAIPVHLLTKEAVELYRNRMTEDGLLALHISNKYVRLEPVVARIAAELGMAARVWNDSSEKGPGKTASSWVILARDEATLGVLAADNVEQIARLVAPMDPLVRWARMYQEEAQAELTVHPRVAIRDVRAWADEWNKKTQLDAVAVRLYGPQDGARLNLILELFRGTSEKKARYGLSDKLKDVLAKEQRERTGLFRDLIRRYGRDAKLQAVLVEEQKAPRPLPERARLDGLAAAVAARTTIDEALARIPDADRSRVAQPLLDLKALYGPNTPLSEAVSKDAAAPKPVAGLEAARQFIQTLADQLTVEQAALALPEADRAALGPALQELIRRSGPDARLRDALAESAKPLPGLEEMQALAGQIAPTKTLESAWGDYAGPTVDELERLIAKYSPERRVATRAEDTRSGGRLTLREAVLLEYGPDGMRLAELALRYNPDRTLDDCLEGEYRRIFHKLDVLKDVPAWTDDYSDVLRVMMIPELQKMRRFFGQPTPVGVNER